ncbi:MAG: hypothetical protein QNJ84_15705 [Alphaproteobacteria bacterium]|nr:hypothetical protein [Alphaproteobacteria bacterium]
MTTKIKFGPMLSGEDEAIVIVKAAPQAGHKYGETVCCAGINLQGTWLRLYPISFRTLDEGQKFGRWDRIRFKWRKPRDDHRVESRRVDQDSLEILGVLKQSERERFLASSIVTSLDKERQQSRSLALLRAEIISFRAEAKSQAEIRAESRKFDTLRAQPDLFNTKPIIPYKPCPYKFKYRYRTEDGVREGTCQDWEIEAAYYHWAKRIGGDNALSEIQRVFGEEYPSKGMLLAMGTHSQHPNTWLINGIVRLDDVQQPTLF